jgi:hypothetical protein
MNTVTFLEQLANHAHFRHEVNELISQQPKSVQNAFMMNNGQQLKQQISDKTFFADKVGVVEF